MGMSERRTHIIKTSLNYYNNLLIRLSELQDIPEVVKTDLANEHVKPNISLQQKKKELFYFDDTVTGS